MALAKPVMGTSVPAPPYFARLSYRLNPVSRADSVTKVMEAAAAASSLYNPTAL